MRESIGATYIFSICLTFIVLFTAYLAISVNYAKAFRIKSNIINMIEENEGYDSSLDEKIEQYLVYQGYSAAGKCALTDNADNAESDGYGEYQREACINIGTASEDICNACIYKLKVTKTNDQVCKSKAYYKVVTFFRFDIPVISTFMNISVRGESKLLNDFAGDSSCKYISDPE